ncbi:MAG: hypothetical protein MUC97_16265 [Bernardetiaceae bacterium]|jgi:hypothetical protein|nr:hypothetical protein [Bernardetiaceae bacterium]
MAKRVLVGTSVGAFLDPAQLQSWEDPTGILATYQKMANPLVYQFYGGARFYRAAGVSASGRAANNWGSWWIYDEEIYKNEQGYFNLGVGLASLVRHKAAVSRDWNDIAGLNVLTLPPGATLLGLAGPAKHQPEYSNKSPMHDPGVLLMGGIEQIYFRAKDLEQLKNQGLALQGALTFE